MSCTRSLLKCCGSIHCGFSSVYGGAGAQTYAQSRDRHGTIGRQPCLGLTIALQSPTVLLLDRV